MTSQALAGASWLAGPEQDQAGGRFQHAVGSSGSHVATQVSLRLQLLATGPRHQARAQSHVGHRRTPRRSLSTQNHQLGL